MRGFVCLAAILVCACASEAPAPVAYGPGAAAPHAHQRPAHENRAPAQTRQRSTQSVAPAAPPNWAAGPGTPLSTWALQPTATFDPLNPPRTHVVGPHQSLSDIATLYQIPVLSLISFNHLTPPYALAPGAIVRLPPPHIHVVRESESFEDIARANDIDLHSLAVLNRMQEPYAVRPGDRIVLPALPGAVEEDERALPPSASPSSTESAGEAPAVHSGGRFVWPLRGSVVARYGVQAGGARLDGIEIAGRDGDPVTAAADGDVVYAGSDLASYGTLVLVRHADNYVTAYGFTRLALVREGEHVRAGQEIAELGTRQDGGARLLFQVRQGTEAVDPTPLLGGAPN